MYKCPDCNVDLRARSDGQYECPRCHSTYILQDAPATNQSTSEAEVDALKKQLEIERLRRQLAELEAQKAKAARESKAKPSGGKAVAKFFKDWGKLIFPALLILIAFITLMTCFCGLRGIYVNTNDPSEFYSFDPTTYVYHKEDTNGDVTIDKGTWSRKNDTLILKDDEAKELDKELGGLLGDLSEKITLKQVSGDWSYFITYGENNKEKVFKRVSIICYRDNLRKPKVNFDANGGTIKATDKTSYQVKLGEKVACPTVSNSEEWIFKGWYTSQYGYRDANQQALPSDKVNAWENVTYYANWQHVDERCISLNIDGNCYAKVYGRVGERVMLPTYVPNSSEYFIGWQYEDQIYQCESSVTIKSNNITMDGVFSSEPYILLYEDISSFTCKVVGCIFYSINVHCDVVIPETHEWKTVVEIDYSAFSSAFSNNQINRLVVPSTVTNHR